MKKINLFVVIASFFGMWIAAPPCQAQTFVNFTINQPAPASASFTFSNVTGTSIAFTGMSSGTNVSWFWDFGDGTTDSTQNPNHIFPSDGNYTVCLTVTDENNCTTTECQPLIYVGTDEIPFVQDFNILPNPFASSAKVNYTLDEYANVRVELLDALGKRIRVIHNGEQAPGQHQFYLEGEVPAGIYFVSIQVGSARMTRRIIKTR